MHQNVLWISRQPCIAQSLFCIKMSSRISSIFPYKNHLCSFNRSWDKQKTERLIHPVWLIYDWCSPDVSVRYNSSNVFERVECMLWAKNCLFSNFSQFRSEEDGGHQSSFFPNSKKSTLTRGEGQKSYGLVPQFGSYFYGSPNGSENINATFSLFFVSSLQVTMLYFPM